MAYTIDYNWQDYDTYANLSAQFAMRDDKIMLESEEFEWWLKQQDYSQGEEAPTKEEQLEDFRDSDSYYEMGDAYAPVMNYMHILQERPRDEYIELVEEYAPNVVVIYIEDLDACGLALTGGGMDLSDCLEQAYYLTDGRSPIKCDQVMSLTEKSEALLMHCRGEQERFGHTSYNSITAFVENWDNQR